LLIFIVFNFGFNAVFLCDGIGYELALLFIADDDAFNYLLTEVFLAKKSYCARVFNDTFC
jgi:hypothetical protein